MDDDKGKKSKAPPAVTGYDAMLSGVVELLEQARRTSARAVNSIMTATYWEIGRRIVEHEQGGEARAEYGVALIKQVSQDLLVRFGRGFSNRNVEQMRLFYLTWPIAQTVSAQLKHVQTTAAYLEEINSEKRPTLSGSSFPLPWSHYVRYALEKLPNKVLAAQYKMAQEV